MKGLVTISFEKLTEVVEAAMIRSAMMEGRDIVPSREVAEAISEEIWEVLEVENPA